MIYGIVGGIDEFDICLRGNGKTATMTYYLMKHKYFEDRTIYTNYKTTFSELLTPEQIKTKVLTENLTNIAIGIDEIQLFLNSMGEKKSIVMEFVHKLLAQTRKRKADVYWTTQRYGDVHKRLRVQTDLTLIPEKFHIDDGGLCGKDWCEREHIIQIYAVELPAPERIPLESFPPEVIGKYYDQFEIIVNE